MRCKDGSARAWARQTRSKLGLSAKIVAVGRAEVVDGWRGRNAALTRGMVAILSKTDTDRSALYEIVGAS